MEHASATAAENKASSLTRLIKNHSKILKLLKIFIHFEKILFIHPDFSSF